MSKIGPNGEGGGGQQQYRRRVRDVLIMSMDGKVTDKNDGYGEAAYTNSYSEGRFCSDKTKMKNRHKARAGKNPPNDNQQWWGLQSMT